MVFFISFFSVDRNQMVSFHDATNIASGYTETLAAPKGSFYFSGTINTMAVVKYSFYGKNKIVIILFLYRMVIIGTTRYS